MCGRYSLEKSKLELEEYYNSKLAQDYKANYNVSPTQTQAVVTTNGFENMKWGLVPQWSKSLRSGFSMINARAETLIEKPTFKLPFLTGQRCLVPATSFYEWKRNSDGSKTPFLIHLTDRSLFSFAGLFVRRKDQEGSILQTFTIITSRPNALMESIHDRMPVILDQIEEKSWLDKTIDPVDLLAVLDGYNTDLMEAYEVSKDVGNVKNNYPELLVRTA